MIARAFTTVFKKWQYVSLSVTVALIVFAFATWLPNIRLLFSILTDPLVPLGDKVMLPINLLGSISTNFTALAVSYTIAIAVLVGINVALSLYQISRQRQFSSFGAGASSLGILSGIFGIIPLLPLKGGEFGIVGVLLLAAATYLLARQITKPLVCES